MSAQATRRIFISSTAEDLGEHRTRVINSVMRLDQHPVAMEFFGARPGLPVDECCALAAGALAVVVIVAHRFGWVPSRAEGGDGARSITWLEVDAAARAGKPVFAFLVDPLFAWPHGKEQDDLVDANADDAALRVFHRVLGLKQFRAWLGDRVQAHFSTPDDLANKVTGSVSRWILDSAPPLDGLQLTELRYVHRYLNAGGDYELRAIYAVVNRGEQDTGRLLPDSIRFFVPADRALPDAVALGYEVPPGGRHRLRGAAQFEGPETVAMPDGTPSRVVGAVYWHPHVAPPIPAGGALTYTCVVRANGTECDAFAPDGSYAGIATRWPTGRIVLRCEAPSGYRFDVEKVVELCSTDAHSTVVIEGMPRAQPSVDADVLTWTIEGRALRVNVHYNLALRIVPRGQHDMIAAFRRGVRFECTRCGKCCTSLSSEVRMTLAEARRISARLGMTLGEFLRRRCRVRRDTVGKGRRGLGVPTITVKTRGGRCPFLTKSGECGIHEVKPLFCAQAPFVWNVAEGGERLWQAIRAYCPGVGRGTLYRPERIQQMLGREKALAHEEFREVWRGSDDARLAARRATHGARSRGGG